MHRHAIALAALAAGSLLLTACGDDDDQTATDMSDVHEDEDSPVADGAREIAVTAEDLAFEPDAIDAEAGEDLAIVLTSEDMLHDFTIDELDVHVTADRGKTGQGGVTVGEPGTYTYYCSVPGHRQAGMEGTLTVE